MKAEILKLINDAREVLLKTAVADAKQNPLVAAFLGWLLREEEFLLLLDGAAGAAAAARGAERNSRNVAVLGFACGVERLKPRFLSDFASQLEWSMGRPNFTTGDEPCGPVADPVSFSGTMAGAENALDVQRREQFNRWAVNVWKSADELIQGDNWRRSLLTVMGRRLSSAKFDSAINHPAWLEAALNRCGWVENVSMDASEVLKAAAGEASQVSDGFEAGLRIAAIDWATGRLNEPITLVLSGGGLRATLFQLGVVAYLGNANDLNRVRGMVSVSGGSILAAHLVVNWEAAIKSREQFVAVAGDLLRFARSDIRNRIVIPWIWSRFNPISWFREKDSRGGRLRSEYERHFQTIRLGKLNKPELPDVAFVATDAIRRERIAFTARQVLRFPVSSESIERGHQTNIVADSTGVPLSLAVATSSCFPPAFPKMHLTHRELGLHFEEFKDILSLNDGGVIGNLGIHVLLSLMEADWTRPERVLVVDAERALGDKPGDGPMGDIDAGGDALSKAETELAKQRFGAKVTFIRLRKRQTEPPGLPWEVQTPLTVFRTDLDAPTLQECQALMLHGFTATAISLGEDSDYGQCAEDGRRVIANILESAGYSEVLQMPTDNDLNKSMKRPKVRVVRHVICVFVVFVGMIVGLVLAAGKYWRSGDEKVGRIKSSSTLPKPYGNTGDSFVENDSAESDKSSEIIQLVCILDSKERENSEMNLLEEVVNEIPGAKPDKEPIGNSWDTAFLSVGRKKPHLVVAHWHSLVGLEEVLNGKTTKKTATVAENEMVVGLLKVAEKSPETRFLLYSRGFALKGMDNDACVELVRAAAERISKQSPTYVSMLEKTQLLEKITTFGWEDVNSEIREVANKSIRNSLWKQSPK